MHISMHTAVTISPAYTMSEQLSEQRSISMQRSLRVGKPLTGPGRMCALGYVRRRTGKSARGAKSVCPV